MAIKDNEKLISIYDEIKKKYNNILNSAKLNENEKINEISTLLKKENTQEYIILGYLKMMENKYQKEEFIKSLKNYECCISEQHFNLNFNKYFTKISSFKKIKSFLEDINNYRLILNFEDKILFLNNIFNLNPIKFIPKLPILYKINPELYLDTLYYLLIKQIKSKKEQYIEEVQTNKDYLDMYNKFSKLKENIESNSEKKKTHYDIIIKYLPLLYNNFSTYIDNYSIFISNVYKNFCIKFNNENVISNDINLFTDFIFFLINYNFEETTKGFIEIWNDSFVEKTYLELKEIVKNYSNKKYSYELENDTIIIKDINFNQTKKIKINNINNYSIEYLLTDFNLFQGSINEFILDKYLKINKYNENLFIRLSWKNFSIYLLKILSSNVINIVAKKICEKQYYNFFNESDLLNIINNIRYFLFDSDFSGYTKGRVLFIYLRTTIYYKNVDNNLNKLFNLANYVIVSIHEIVGHLNIRIQNYLGQKEYLSPKPEKGSDYANSRNKESGEYIEEQLFDRILESLTIKEILFILDIKNYNFNEFKNNFLKCNNEDIEVSNELNEILKIYGIDISKINTRSKKKYRLLKINNNILEVPSRHPLNYDFDD